MFIGHFALAFAARRAEKGASLGTYMAAAQFPDLIWPYLLLAGVERVSIVPGDTAFTPLRFDSYPISHSLLTVAAGGALFGVAHWWRQRRARAAVLLALLVVSHWILDFVTHRPDLPIAPGLPVKLGLGLWNSVAGTLVVETILFGAAVWLYLRDTRPRDGIGRHAMAAFLALLVVIYLAAAFGPPPPSARAVALSTTPAILFAFWASWADRHRVARP
jgi:FtsH-binding integral membrane protein